MISAEIARSSSPELEAYLQGALKDGTWSPRHRTHRIGQANREWIDLIAGILRRLNCGAWVYREGSSRELWVVETSAPFLCTTFDPTPLVGTPEGIHYARGYFDAEGGVPHDLSARLYLQLVQKSRMSLESLAQILSAAGIKVGKLHVPSIRVDPDLWRFYVRASSHIRFMEVVSSWHPRKRPLIEARLRETVPTFQTSPAPLGTKDISRIPW